MAKPDDHKVVYVRMPKRTYLKLQKLLAAKLKRGERASQKSVICALIEHAPER